MYSGATQECDEEADVFALFQITTKQVSSAARTPTLKLTPIRRLELPYISLQRIHPSEVLISFAIIASQRGRPPFLRERLGSLSARVSMHNPLERPCHP